MKVLKPSKNKQTGDPKSHGYTAYDFDAEPDLNYYSSFYGKVVQAKNSETRNWIANKTGDPYKPATGTRKLRTEDYGNYIKIKAEIDGKTFYQLGSHFKPGTVLPVGTEVQKGQVVAQAGNTGNSTGTHSHTEYRDETDAKIAVEFVDEEVKPPMDTQSKEQIIIDVYKALTGEYPTDDEKKWRLQENKNTVELIESVTGDKRFFKKFVEPYIPTQDINWHETALLYQETFEKLKEIFGLPPADNTEEVLGKARNLINELNELKKLQEPKTIYKYADKDFQSLFKVGNILIAIEK